MLSALGHSALHEFQEARKLPESEGVALNQLINLAVEEKVSALAVQNAADRKPAARFVRSAAIPCAASRTSRPPGRHKALYN